MPLLLAADDVMPALPWPYVLALCGALGATITVLWRRDVNRENQRTSREKEIADQARTDGAAAATTAANAAAAMRGVADEMQELHRALDKSDAERSRLAKQFVEELGAMKETVERCRIRV